MWGIVGGLRFYFKEGADVSGAHEFGAALWCKIRYWTSADTYFLMLYVGKGNDTMSFLYSKAEKALKDVIFLYR